MEEIKLKTSIWVKSQIRICDLNFLPVFVVRKGDPDAGSILLKLNRLDAGIEVFSQVRNSQSINAWMSISGDSLITEEIATAKIEKQILIDPDIWVLEIEDPLYKYKVNEPII